MDIADFFNKRVVNDRYKRRLESLKRRRWDVEHIKAGVDSVVRNFNAGAESLVIYGEPQSGKTEVMIALTCALLDMHVKTIFVVMNDNVELESQNFKRFKEASAEINPTPMSAPEFIDLKDKDKKLDVQRIIFCRKNAANLEKLITECRFLKDRVVIDDEADYASPDSKINKLGQKSAINKLVGQLGKLDDGGRYIGVTATPGRLDLNNTFANRAEDWVFLKSHDHYIGRSYFFPISEADIQKSNFILERQPEEGDSPKFLEEAFLRFITKVAILNLQRKHSEDHENYSMLIHTHGQKAFHKEDKSDLEGFVHNFTARKIPKLEKYYSYIDAYSKKLESLSPHAIKSTDIFEYIADNIGRRSILVINSENDKANVDASCNPRDLFTFAIGGNIVSRGLTFNNLLTFFFSRNVKGKMQQNTYVQRARMFGTRPYIKWFELCIPDSLYEDWATCFADHEMSIQSAIRGDIRHFSSKKTSSADSGSIDNEHVVGASGEVAAGAIFEINHNLIEMLRFTQNKPISGLRRLIDSGDLPIDALDPSILGYIDYMTGDSDNDSAIIDIEGSFIYISDRLNNETLMRDRGGLISQLVKGRKKYLEKPHLFLITADNSGRARFVYRLSAGKRILKNVLSKPRDK